MSDLVTVEEAKKNWHSQTYCLGLLGKSGGPSC